MRNIFSIALMLLVNAQFASAQLPTDFQRYAPGSVPAGPVSPSPAIAAGVTGVINMVAVTGVFDVATDDVNRRVFAMGATTGVITVLDMDNIANVLGTLNSPGGTNQQLGIAYDSDDNTLLIVDNITTTLFEIDADDATVLNANPLALPLNGLAGGMSFRSADGTLVVRDVGLDMTHVFDQQGNLLDSIADPLAASLGFVDGLFGNGVAVNDQDSFDVITGNGACIFSVGPDMILRQDFGGDVIGGRQGNLAALRGNPPFEIFPAGVAFSPTGSTGTPTYYFGGDYTDTVYETDAIEPCLHPSITNHQCSLNGLEVVGTFDENDTYDEVRLYRNGGLLAIVGNGQYMDTLPGPGVYTYTLLSDVGGEECGGGNPCVVVNEVLPPPAPVCPTNPDEIDISQSSDSMSVVGQNSIACVFVPPMGFPMTPQFGTSEQSYLRHFNFADLGVNRPIEIEAVEIGVENATPGPGLDFVPVMLKIYGTDVDPVAGSFAFADLTLLHEEEHQLEQINQNLRCLPVDPSLSIDPAEFRAFVVEILSDNYFGCTSFFFIGSNANGQSAPSFLASAGCLVPEPTDLALIGTGFPNMHIVMNIYTQSAGGFTFIRGDSNNDGVFSGLGDGLFTLNAQFVPNAPQPECLDAADANGDGEFNGLADGLFTLNAQFVPGSPPPPPPFPACGIGTLLLGCAQHACN